MMLVLDRNVFPINQNFLEYGMIKIRLLEDITPHQVELHDVNLGGLSFDSEIEWEVNAIIGIRIQAETSIEFVGRVTWCKKLSKLYRTSIEFIREGTSREEMIEELCRLEVHKAMLSPF